MPNGVIRMVMMWKVWLKHSLLNVGVVSIVDDKVEILYLIRSD